MIGSLTRVLATSLVLLGALLGGRAAGAADELRLPASFKPEMAPVVCSENRDLVIRDRSIWSAGDGIRVSGNCEVQVIDSHISADGVGIRVDGNGEVQVVGSFVQGRRAAVFADGNADVEYRDSTLRGGSRVEGNADAVDGGGNHFESIPGSADDALTRGESLFCGDGDRMTVVHRHIDTDRDGVTLHGDCELLLSDSYIRAGGSAVRVVGSGSVRVRNSTLAGGVHAVLIEGAGAVRAAGTNLVGALAIEGGRFLDDGGNARADDLASAARRRAPGADGGTPTSGTARQPGIRIGPGGVEVSGGGGSSVRVGGGGVEVSGGEGEGGSSVKVGTGGVEIRGDGKPREPIETCSELCEIWPGVVSSKRDCVSTVLDVLGYPIEETLDCIEVDTEAQCRVCAAEIRVRDRDCRTAFNRCIAR